MDPTYRISIGKLWTEVFALFYETVNANAAL